MQMPKEHFFGAITSEKFAEVCSEPLPDKLGPTDVLVKILICNICTTDYQTWLGTRNNYGTYPFAAGHEWTGEVVMVGEKVQFLKVGDRVGECRNGCGECINCRQRHTEECLAVRGPRPKINGFFGSRSFSNYKICKENCLIKVSSEVEPQFTAFLEPLSSAVAGCNKLRLVPGDTAVVIGAGSMGMLWAMTLHAWGCRVIITELSEKKLERARSLGYAYVVDSGKTDPVAAVMEITEGVGADAVIPTVPAASIYNQSYKMMKKRNGKFLLYAAGYPAPTMELDPNTIHYGRTEILGQYDNTVTDLVQTAKLINYKLVDPSKAWEGKIYPLKDIQNAYIHAASPDMYRISVDLQDF